MNKRNTNVRYAVTAAAVTAAVAGVSLIGCRAHQSAQAAVPEAAINAAGGVEAVKAHTQIAQELVEQAMPNSNPVGQAQLSAVGVEHHAVLASADRTVESLQQLKADFAHRGDELAVARTDLANQQEKYRKLESQWYVNWGIRIEQWLWTAAISWLLVSAGSVALGGGNPLSWIAKLRGVLAGFSAAAKAA